jgi:hypothetical protein
MPFDLNRPHPTPLEFPLTPKSRLAQLIVRSYPPSDRL